MRAGRDPAGLIFSISSRLSFTAASSSVTAGPVSIMRDEWARAELESRAVAAGLSLLEARRTIESAFKAAKPRDLPR
jgi:hypothetical protein